MSPMLKIKNFPMTKNNIKMTSISKTHTSQDRPSSHYRSLPKEEFDDISSRILYEDNHLLILNKKVGEIVQGDKTGDEPLSEKLKAFISERDLKPGRVFIGVPHRLDRPVSGIAVFAKTSKALERLNEMFREGSSSGNENDSASGNNDAPLDGNCSASGNNDMHIKDNLSLNRENDRRINKTYWALVEHCPEPNEGVLRHYLLRNEKQNKSYAYSTPKSGAKEAVLKYHLLKATKNYFLVEIELLTGRHHQIRCQLSAIGCPIKGDLKYGARRSNKDGGISLHARTISIIHPVRKERIEIIAPTEMESL